MRTVGLVFPELSEKPEKAAKKPAPEQKKDTASKKEK